MSAVTLTPTSRRRWPSFTDLCVPLVFVAALIPGGSFLSIGLLLYLSSRQRELDALGVLVLLVLSNPILFHTDGMEFARYLVLFVALFRLWPKGHLTSVIVAGNLALVAALIGFNALLVSALPSISLFKGALLVFTVWTLFNTQKPDWTAFAARLDRFIPWYLLLSLPTYFIPSVGFARNGTGFQGLTNQPQAFGVLAALFAAWLLYRWWARLTPLSMSVCALTVAGLLGSVILSEARTALLGFTVALILTWIVQLLSGARKLGLKILMSLFLGGIGLFGISRSETLGDFIFKRAQAADVLSAANESRGLLVQRSLANFQQEPLLGIGFGVPSNMETAEVTYAPIVNIPISVALEKGVWVSATLEEQGVIGMGALLLLFLSLSIYGIRHGTLMGIPMLGFLLASNLGEMTMFSMGGLGLLQWLLVLAAFRLRADG